jgi:hypothetical protein
MNITEFLEARIAEDEVQATKHLPSLSAHGLGDYGLRVLAECEAKRTIAELHDSVEDRNWQSGKDHDFLWCGSCGTLDDAPVPYPCETLQTLAAVYKDHPDYQQDWAL